MEGLPVTLIVKAPNQQIEDQTIKCELSWTIQKLKGYLSEVYPCKPKTEEQKLIYSGQLLSDTVVLKDVLRRYEGQDTHTVHLVCSVSQSKIYKNKGSLPKNRHLTNQSSQDASSSGTADNTQPVSEAPADTTRLTNENSDPISDIIPDGLRRRVEGANIAPNMHNNINRDVPQPNVNPFHNNPAFNGQFPHAYYWDSANPGANPWNNAAAYQWMNYNSPNAGGNPGNVPNVGGAANGEQMVMAAQVAWMQQMQAQYMQFYSQMMQTGGVMNVPQTYLLNQQMAAQIAENNANPNQEVEAVQQAVNNNNDGQAELDNWDWLDWFYIITRVMVMFAIVYFYSSPIRFFIVLVSGFFVYLYQIGYFHALANINNLENNNNNNQQQPLENNNAAEPQPNAAEVEAEPAEPQNAALTGETTPAQNPENVPDNQQQSLLTITWTVVTSFIASLLPETPNAL